MDAALPEPPIVATPAAPPTAPAPITAAPAKAVWPVVLGTICIVFGVGGLLVNVWGVIANLFLGDFFARLAAPDGSGDAAERMTGHLFASGLLSVLGVAIAGLLLASGIGMIVRRRWSSRTVQLWAVLKIVFSLAALVPALLMQQVQFQSMNTGPRPIPANYLMIVMVAGLVLGLLWAWALPIFVLLWFRRAAVRSEVANWGASA